MSYYATLIEQTKSEYLNSLGNGYYAEILRQKYNAEEGEWITVKGSHILVKPGQKKEDAVKQFLKEKEKDIKDTNYFKNLPKETQEKYETLSKEKQEGIGYCLLGKPVCDIKGTEFAKSKVKLTEQVDAYFKKKFQGKVKQKELGEVSLDLKGIKSDIAHGIGRLKAAAFYAVPNAIQKGVIIERQKNWKNRGYDTFVLVAPITVNKERYAVEVIVKKSQNKHGLYLHEVEISERLDKLFWTPL